MKNTVHSLLVIAAIAAVPAFAQMGGGGMAGQGQMRGNSQMSQGGGMGQGGMNQQMGQSGMGQQMGQMGGQNMDQGMGMEKMGGPMGQGMMPPGAMITQGMMGRLSPHETVGVNLGGKVITVTYGRPYTKSPTTGEMRAIWGSLVPWNEPWRLGADEATLLLTPSPLKFGNTTIPAGAYTLYMLPRETGTSELVFSRNVGKWGIPVDTTADVARVPLTKSALNPTNDQLMLGFEESNGTVTLKIQWAATQYAATFTLGM